MKKFVCTLLLLTFGALAALSALTACTTAAAPTTARGKDFTPAPFLRCDPAKPTCPVKVYVFAAAFGDNEHDCHAIVEADEIRVGVKGQRTASGEVVAYDAALDFYLVAGDESVKLSDYAFAGESLPPKRGFEQEAIRQFESPHYGDRGGAFLAVPKLTEVLWKRKAGESVAPDQIVRFMPLVARLRGADGSVSRCQTPDPTITNRNI